MTDHDPRPAEPRTVPTKAEFLRLSALGLLGNRMPSWDTVEEARASGYAGPVMIRDRTPSSPYMRADVPMGEVARVLGELQSLGMDTSRAYLTHMTATANRLLNAEVCRLPGCGLYVNYSTVQAHLRKSLDEGGREATGSAAVAILRHCLDPSSYDDLMGLLDLYPDAVIELTAYEGWMGDLPGRNTIVWELRDY